MTTEWAWLAINWFSMLQTVSIVTGLFVVAKQQRDSIRQRKRESTKRESESLDKILDGNQQLIILAFSHPELRPVLEDKEADPFWEHSYLQLWLNRYSQVHSYVKDKIFRDEQVENLERDMQDFMRKQNMQRHWKECGRYYTTSFQAYINAFLKKNEPPMAAHQDTD